MKRNVHDFIRSNLLKVMGFPMGFPFESAAVSRRTRRPQGLERDPQHRVDGGRWRETPNGNRGFCHGE